MNKEQERRSIKMFVGNMSWELIPQHCRAQLHEYLLNGCPVGSFLTAILQNDFMKAVTAADDINLANIVRYAQFLYMDAPTDCYGSPAKVHKWIEDGGYMGKGGLQ